MLDVKCIVVSVCVGFLLLTLATLTLLSKKGSMDVIGTAVRQAD